MEERQISLEKGNRIDNYWMNEGGWKGRIKFEAGEKGYEEGNMG